MIYIGLTGWGDHDSLYEGTRAADKLSTYAGYFPIVELDSSFYAVQPKRSMEKWAHETPDSFSFIVKAYQGITGHQTGYAPFDDKESMFAAYIESLQPLGSKLAMVLCQFPPWFDCRKENVQWVRYVKEKLAGYPVALEFRHQSWFSGAMRERTIAFMEQEDFIHSICDEPQAGVGSIPTVLHPTNELKTLVRLHGRNTYGWNDTKDGKWREVRYLYRYNKEELEEWRKHVLTLHTQSKDIYVIFNNNSGGDAADNARQLIDMLGITYEGLAPRQLDLF